MKTAFLTRYSLYEYVVILFSLYNTLGIFYVFINDTLREYLDVFYLAYLDNILFYSSEKTEYEYYTGKVLKKLKLVGLFLDINKFDFYIIEVKYLGLIITKEGIKIN